VRRTTRATLILAAMVSTLAAALATANPASAGYKPQPFRLVCASTASGGTLENGVCVLPYGVTTAPDSYSATITATGAKDLTLAVASGSFPSGLTLPAASTTGSVVITGNPAKAGVYDFTIKATAGSETVTLAYQITITAAGPPDQLLCTLAGNGAVLESGTCVLPDAIAGLPYAGHLLTSHQAGGRLSVIAGSLPPGLTLPATFTGSGDTISGTPAPADNGSTFTVQGTGDQGQPLYQAYSITVDPNEPLTINASGGTTLEPGTVGQAYFPQDFFISGGGNPYTWTVAAGQLPPGMILQTVGDPRDVDNQLAGTPTTAGTYAFTMKVTDYDGQQATQQFTLTIKS
jgi:hypothetical protein